MKQLLAILLAAALCILCCGCQTAVVSTASSSGEDSTQTASVPAAMRADLFSDRDFEIGYSDETVITLSGTSASCDSDAVNIDGGTVTITKAGTYLLTGTLDDGQVIVDIPEDGKLQLVLQNASIACSGQAALYVRSADKVFLTTADGTENTLRSTGEFTQIDDNNVDGAIFAKSDLTLNGSGLLTVSCEAGHGIVCKDDLRLTSGSYAITSAKQGLSGKDSVRIAGGTVEIESGTDGIHAENDDADQGFVYLCGGTVTIVSQGDGLDASGKITIDDGTLTVTAGGGSETVQLSTPAAPGGDFDPAQQDGQTPPELPDGQAPDMTQAPPELPDGQTPDMSQTPPELPDGQTPQDGETPPEPPDSTAPQAPQNGQESNAAAQSTEDSGTFCKAVKSDQLIEILGGSFTLDAADDTLHSNGSIVISGGSFSLASGDDGIHADGQLEISGGTLDISKSYEGLEGGQILVSGGQITLVSSDDGLNAATDSETTGFDVQEDASITITGGSLSITASGDGIDSNGALEITGGDVQVSLNNAVADGTLDYGTTAEITGGSFVGFGCGNMEVNFTTAAQGSILYTFDTQHQAGETVTLTGSDGTVLLSQTASYGFRTVTISLPQLQAGQTYTLTAGSESVEITLEELLYGSGSSDAMPGGGPGNFGGPGGPGAQSA